MPVAMVARDEFHMRRAIELARQAEAAGEVPVGALIVRNGEVIAEGFNRPISTHDPTAHAEMIALRAAAARSDSYRLLGTTLYVTLEPCAMRAPAPQAVSSTSCRTLRSITGWTSTRAC